MMPGSPVTLALLIVVLAAGYAAVRAVVRSRRPAQIVPLVQPVVEPTRFGPAGGKGCEGDHDPVPVIPGEGSPLIESTEPVAWLCSKCLASVNEDGKGYTGGGVILAGKITADRIATGRATLGVYTVSIGGGRRIEVRPGGDDDWFWQVLDGFGDALAAGESSKSFNDALTAACRVAGVEPDSEEIRAHGAAAPIRTMLTGAGGKPIKWGSPAVFEQNARALEREAKWGAGLIVYDPANLDRLRERLDQTSAAVKAILNHYPDDHMTEAARQQVEGLIEDATWLRAAIRQEEARETARLSASGIKTLDEAEEEAAGALLVSTPRRSLVDSLQHDRARLAKTMSVMSAGTASEQRLLVRMQQAIGQLDRAIEFHSTTARPALVLHPPTHDYPRH